MWVCTCGHKNSNSSKQCHGKQCNKARGEIVKPAQNTNPKTARNVRDYCPVCKAHHDFARVGKNKWSCTNCHKKFRMTGKPVPEKTAAQSQEIAT